MSADQHSQQPSDSIMRGVNIGTVYPGDCRDQPTTVNESRDEADVAEMLSLTTKLTDLSVTSANPTGCISEPLNANKKIYRKRTIHDPYPVLEHYLHGLQSVSTALCPRHAAGAETIRRYHRSVSENRRHMSAAVCQMLESMAAPDCSKRCSRSLKRLLACLGDDLPRIAKGAISRGFIRDSSTIMQD